jgi:RND family efflux transporter MFP subunit
MKKQLYTFITVSVVLSACGKKTNETTPTRKDVIETVFASGILEADGTYALRAQSDGYLVQVSFKENDLVKAGQVIALVDNKQNVINTESANTLFEIAQSNTSLTAPLLAQAKTSMETAKEKMEFDGEQTQRYKKLWEANSISKVDYESMALQYQTSQGNYKNALENYNHQKQQADQQLAINKAQKNANNVLTAFNQIKAVYAGKVYSKLKQNGDYVRKGDEIATIGNANLIYAKVSIDESSIAKIKVGQEAVVQLNVNKEKNYKGTVAEILPTFNEQTQSFICKVYFVDALGFTIINTQLQVNIITGTAKNALLIPRKYLGFGNTVTVKGANEPVKVKTKFVSSEWVQVESGLDETAVIITDKK